MRTLVPRSRAATSELEVRWAVEADRKRRKLARVGDTVIWFYPGRKGPPGIARGTVLEVDEAIEAARIVDTFDGASGWVDMYRITVIDRVRAPWYSNLKPEA